jgi:voltage-gated sodium channel
MFKNLILNEKFILFIILLNSLVIFIQGFSIESNLLKILEISDQFFTFIFIIELFIKLKSYGRKNYFNNGWNIFDFVLVVIAVPSFIAIFIPHNLIDLDFLLIFRTFRVFKFFRFIRFVPKIDKLINGIYRAAKSSILIIIGFFVFNFIISLISCFMFKDLSPEYFADPLISFYSIFKIFTVEGWYEIPDSIVSDNDSIFISIFTRLYFITILLFGGIFGLSLVNSIFVDSMISDNNDELEEKVDSLEKKINTLIDLHSKQKKE